MRSSERPIVRLAYPSKADRAQCHAVSGANVRLLHFCWSWAHRLRLPDPLEKAMGRPKNYCPAPLHSLSGWSFKSKKISKSPVASPIIGICFSVFKVSFNCNFLCVLSCYSKVKSIKVLWKVIFIKSNSINSGLRLGVWIEQFFRENRCGRRESFSSEKSHRLQPAHCLNSKCEHPIYGPFSIGR